MDTRTALAIFFILWGLGTAYVALKRPAKIWQLGKIQGFVQLIGDSATTILFLVMALVALAGGFLLL
jgi:hypothetical protein